MSEPSQHTHPGRIGRREVLRTAGWATAAMTVSSVSQAASGPPPLPNPAMGSAPPHFPTRLPGVCGVMTGAEAVVGSLQLEGTACVYGIPGAQNNELWDAFKRYRMAYLLVAHEFSASVMADACARVTGSVGVCCVVPGPGLTNTLTGLGEAKLDSVPVVALVTDVKRGPGAPAYQVHELPGVEILQPVTKGVYAATTVEEIPGLIHAAHQLARQGEPGPVGVVIPYDLLAQRGSFNDPGPLIVPRPFDEPGYQRALNFLDSRSGCRIGIFAGMGCQDASESLTAVAELMQAPVATSVSGKGVIPENHPLAVGWGYGAYGTRAAEEAFRHVDVVLAIGVRYSEVSTANYAVPQPGPLIHVDANPECLGRNVPAEVKVCADSRLFLDRLRADAGRIARKPDARMWNLVARARHEDARESAKVYVCEKVDPLHLLTRLDRQMGDRSLLFIDVTSSMHWAAEVVRVSHPRHYFAPMNNQSMGYAIPAAIGAQRVRLDQQVVAVTGDGCLLMSAMELSTAARAHLPVKIFVIDDGTYHYMQMLQEPVYRRTTATVLPHLDYAALAQGLGLGYFEIADPSQLDNGVAHALAIPGPVLVRVLSSYEGRPIRWLNALRSQYIDGLSTDQKIRFATRIAGRSLLPGGDDD